jgi:hypothetical protein
MRCCVSVDSRYSCFHPIRTSYFKYTIFLAIYQYGSGSCRTSHSRNITAIFLVHPWSQSFGLLLGYATESKNSSYSRYSTSFKLAVNLGIADQTDISSLPSSTRHNFRNTNFTDIVGKEYEGLTQRLDQVKEILDSRTATAVAHSIARVAFFMKRLGKDVHRLKKLKSPQIRQAFIELVERTKKFIPEKQILKFFNMTQRRFSLWKANPIGCTRAPRFECVASYPTQLTNDEISKVIKVFQDQTKASWSAFAIAATLVRERIVVASIPNILSYARDLGLHKRKIKKKKQKRGSIEAEDVDEVWHTGCMAEQQP